MREENKRIAKNTLIVYIRLAFTTVLGLISSRLVLKALGASDFGLYNVVGSIVVAFSFLSSALSGATTRFINYEQGKEDGDVNKIFNVSFTVHVVFSFISLFLLETIGLIYINHYLNVAVGRELDALFVFQVSTIVSCVGIISVPFQSVFIAKEKFIFIAAVDITSTLIRFALILVLLYYPGNSLRFYSVSMAMVLLLTNLTYFLLSKKYYPDIVRFRVIKRKGEYKEILSYINFNLLGAGALITRNQGSNMLINYFFGTVVNAAYAIAFTVQNYIITFVGNFDTASFPQITQSLSSGDKTRAFFLTTSTCRACMLLTMVLLFPVYSELAFLLRLWLGDNVPEGTELFCKCTLMVALVSSTSGGVTQLINGIGKLKWFTLQYTILYVVALVIGLLLCGWGYPPHTVIIAYIVADCLSRINQLYLLHRIIGLDIGDFVRGAYLRPSVVFLCGVAYCLIARFLIIESTGGHILSVLFSLIYMLGVVFFVGLNNNERKLVLKTIKQRLNFC